MAEERIEYAVEVNFRIRRSDRMGRRVDTDFLCAGPHPTRAGAFERADWINRLAPKTDAVVMKRTVTYGDWTKA